MHLCKISFCAATYSWRNALLSTTNYDNHLRHTMIYNIALSKHQNKQYQTSSALCKERLGNAALLLAQCLCYATGRKISGAETPLVWSLEVWRGVPKGEISPISDKLKIVGDIFKTFQTSACVVFRQMKAALLHFLHLGSGLCFRSARGIINNNKIAIRRFHEWFLLLI